MEGEPRPEAVFTDPLPRKRPRWQQSAWAGAIACGIVALLIALAMFGT